MGYNGHAGAASFYHILSIFYLIIFALIFSTMYLTSSSLTYGPLGRHNPLRNNSSLTPFTYDGILAYTGCLCIGFHNGLDSIPASSNAILIASTCLIQRHPHRLNVPVWLTFRM